MTRPIRPSALRPVTAAVLATQPLACHPAERSAGGEHAPDAMRYPWPELKACPGNLGRAAESHGAATTGQWFAIVGNSAIRLHATRFGATYRSGPLIADQPGLAMVSGDRALLAGARRLEHFRDAEELGSVETALHAGWAASIRDWIAVGRPRPALGRDQRSACIRCRCARRAAARAASSSAVAAARPRRAARCACGSGASTGAALIPRGTRAASRQRQSTQ